jgi:hypothetical protein
MSKNRNPYIKVGARVTHTNASTTEPQLDPDGEPIVDDDGEQILVDVKPVVGTIRAIDYGKDEALVDWPRKFRNLDPWFTGDSNRLARHNLWALRVAK